jgi:hypothetical protein
MSDRGEKSSLWLAREAEGLGRERVAQLLDPPITSKTLERWERGSNVNPIPRWRLRQLAQIYRTKVDVLLDEVAA